MWALLPVKDLDAAKGRLAGVLGPMERRRLVHAMLADVLAALCGLAGLDGIAVVSRDGEASALARRHGARLLCEDENRGQTAAVEAGMAALAADRVGAVMTVPGDVPLTSAQELGRVLAAHRAPPAMTIVPARDLRGSNCVVCAPPGAVPLRFGENSFHPHIEAARRSGIVPTVLRLPGLGLDVDTPDDLRALLRRPAATRTHAYLEESGIAARIGGGEAALPAGALSA